MIHTTKKALTTALSRLARVIPARSSNPALTAVHVSVTETALLLSGTNLEIDLRLTVPAEIGPDLRGQSFLVPAHLWQQGAAKLPGELVTLELNGSALHMKAGGSAQKIQTGSAEVYAPLSFPPHHDGLPVPAPDLLSALRSVGYAASSEAFQAILRGILLHLTPTLTRAVASDGYRMAVCTRPPLPGLTAPQSLIIPRRNAEEVAAVLEGTTDAALHTAPGLLSLTTDSAALNVKLLEGEFPDWERVVPREIRLSAHLSGAALAEALDRVALFADKNANNRVELRFAGDALELIAQGDYGEGREGIAARIEGTEAALTLALNANHALDALKQMGGGEVRVDLSGTSTPVKFTAAGDPGVMAVTVALRE